MTSHRTPKRPRFARRWRLAALDTCHASQFTPIEDSARATSRVWLLARRHGNSTADYPSDLRSIYGVNANEGASPGQVSTGWNYARPSSNHAELVNAYFCSGSLRPLRDDIDYRV